MQERKYRAWYTHSLPECSLSEIQEMADKYGVDFEDPNNPTKEEIQEVYQEAFAEMSDPWEITANGHCVVEEVK